MRALPPAPALLPPSAYLPVPARKKNIASNKQKNKQKKTFSNKHAIAFFSARLKAQLRGGAGAYRMRFLSFLVEISLNGSAPVVSCCMI
jgi:hypothetical protein